MDWNDWLSILRWRAVEEGDAEGAILSEERRREATARTRAGLTSEALRDGPVGDREMAFLHKRSAWLEREMIGWSGSLVRLMERLIVPAGRWSWAWAGWAAAGAAGFGLSGLGQAGEFNLLALPLVGVLAWNAVILLLALVWEWRSRPVSTGGFLAWLAGRIAPAAPERALEGEAVTGLSVDQRFALLAAVPALERLQRRLRAWFHLAAAVLALGSAAGLYARGWSREYRAVWESTLLTETTARQFFGSVFAPAAGVLKLELPLGDLAGMHRTAGRAQRPAPALPWIHLYAGTLLLLVALPRCGLAGLTAWRARRVLEKRLRSLGWPGYLERLLRAAEGGQETVSVLIHATDATPHHREVWARGIRSRFGGLVQPEMIRVALGDEDEFVAGWRPASARAVIVFNLATTPEAEVQRRFALEVRQTLKAAWPAAELVVLLDATSIGNRWSPDKLAGRERLWNDLLQGAADAVLVAAVRAA